MKSHHDPLPAFRALTISCLLLLLVIPGARAQTYEKVFSFTDANAAASNKGKYPYCSLVRGIDGNLYGTTALGGTTGYGTVFRMTSAGVLTTLVEFANTGTSNEGEHPMDGLVQGSNGDFYGTTLEGGTSGYGTVFKVTPGGTLTTLVEFTNNGTSNKGYYAFAGLILGSDGSFYGTTVYGGANGDGTVFKMTPGGVLTTLVEFTGNGASNKGRYPTGGLVQGSDGNYYGTTSQGGANDCGTVFKMTPSGVLTTLVEFAGNAGRATGSSPDARLVQGIDGNFYGTTSQGGANNLGTVFKVTPAGVLTTLVDFTGNGASNKGSCPEAALVLGTDGNFYGTTETGGGNDCGTVFRMTSAGALTTLVEFSGSGAGNKGKHPVAALILGSNGCFFGTTKEGGATGNGTVFRMTPDGALTTLVEFTDTGGCKEPDAGLVQGSDGSFYGTTAFGGLNGDGAAFKITPGGPLMTLVNFSGDGESNKGSTPYGHLVLGRDGNFYGTTAAGGANDYGTVFKMTPDGVLTTLVGFTNNGASNKGRKPLAGLVLARDRNFYGTTSQGGATDNGTVFRMTPAGALTTLVEFTDNAASNKGRLPYAGLVVGSDGNLYGTTLQGGAYGCGTVFKMTTAGVLTTLVEFTDTGTRNRGKYPAAKLALGSDGNLYGTTAYGGANDGGTVFKMTSEGELATLVEFTGNGVSNKGRIPFAGLVQGSDGNFYGTTFMGGSADKGTVFEMTPAGVLTTLFDFADDSVDAYPRAELMFASDGNLYGTASGQDSGGSGSVFRLVYPGAPSVSLSGTEQVVDGRETVGVSVFAEINARGAPTTVTIEYGRGAPGGTDPSYTEPMYPSPLSGSLTTLVEITLGGLPKGTSYWYRISAASSAGTTVSPVVSFGTLGEPAVTISAASSIAPTSATFNGTVNARNFDATVVFQYGTDGSTFSNEVDASPATVPGTENVAVHASVADLTKGTTYYYRIQATNAAGTTVSGASSFITLTDPVATVGPATYVTSNRAILNGSVNAKGAATSVTFEYGTAAETGNGTTPDFPHSWGATPSTVDGNADTAVSATVTGLTQGATYYYRVKGSSAGGVGVSTAASLTLDILSGFTRTFPGALPAAQGFVFVTLLPSGIASGWRFVGEQQWRASGVPVGGLTTGDREIEYRPVPGYIQPLRETVSVISGGAATLVTGEYYLTQSGGSGGLSVVLKPTALADLSVPTDQRAQWRLLGEDDTQWRNSGVTISGLAPGVYLVECKPLTGRTTPAVISAPVQTGATKVATATYLLADTSAGTPPSALPWETVNSSGALPYAFVGQLRNDVGSATGFVVKARVVATAAHVVFDDGTLSYVTGLQWLFQRNAGTYEPTPQVPRGFYVFDGYAAQRTAEATPGVSTPQSQNLDAAALYFLEDAGRGGFGGYLGSNSDDNEFLLSPKLKMLVGYPVDGIATANQGRMHATPASKVTFAQSYGHTFTTSDISSSGGNSGGPLCVQFDDGIYYPAAIYLGGSAQTVVRAIDTDVIDLFDRAEVSGNGGGNNTSGGISQVNTPVSGAVFAAASLKVDILPAAASGEATWKLSSSGTAWDSGKQLDTLAPGDYTLSFTPVTGFLTPPSASITLTAGNLSSITQTYDGITAQPSDRTVAVGGSATFTVGVSGTPTAYQWRRDGFNITGATAATYTLSNATLADSGNYRVVVTWSDGAQTSSAATLSVTEAVAKPWAVTGTGMFQGGGHAGLLWFNATTRETAIWLMNGLTAEGTASYAPGSDWSVVGTGDFDGDGQTDLLWRNAATGGVVIWFMNGTSIASSKWIYDSGTTWVPCQLADFNGDGKTDILWHNTVTGDYAIWLMNGSDALLGASGFAVAAGWQITQVADFDGDGKADLLWRNSTTGGVVLWFMNGTAIAGSKWIYDSGLSWTPAYIADFNGDGKADILWQNTDGSQAIWLMNGSGELLGASGFSVAAGWQVALVADFDGDGKTDILWRNSTTGGVVLWTMNGTSVANTAWVYNDGPSLTPVRAADFNGDGKADLLWQGTDGSLAIWLMNGGTCLSSAGVY